jgi:hypothetical protein
MPHPFMTEELVRQRRAGLHAESRNERLVRQLRPRVRADPEGGRFAITARTFARQLRALVARTRGQAARRWVMRRAPGLKG